MLAKNILKKFNTRDMFDGVEDEIDNTNITLRFIKYAYYQNLFLVRSKNNNKDNLIHNILDLIDDSFRLSRDTRLKDMVALVKDYAERMLEEDSQPHSQEIERIMSEQVLKGSAEEESFIIDMIQSLILIFFDSNNYNINHKSLYTTLMLIYNRPLFLKTLKKTIIIVNEEEERVMYMIRQNYFEVKLLVETAEVWLTDKYVEPKYEYTPIIHYLVDKLYTIVNIMVNPTIEDSQVALTSRLDKAMLKRGTSAEKQQIVMNMGHHKEVLSFLMMNSLLFEKI